MIQTQICPYVAQGSSEATSRTNRLEAVLHDDGNLLETKIDRGIGRDNRGTLTISPIPDRALDRTLDRTGTQTTVATTAVVMIAGTIEVVIAEGVADGVVIEVAAGSRSLPGFGTSGAGTIIRTQTTTV